MSATQPTDRHCILRLVLGPGLITLAVTLLRLLGELQRWSRTWFNPEQGGGGAVVGIIWLAPVFGIYFALKLSRADEGLRSVKRAIALALVGTAAVIAFGVRAASLFNTLGLQGFLICEGGVALAAAALQYPAWPRLFKVLIAYTVTARIPVLVVMFFALRGSWGTHYDAVPSFLPADFGFWRRFLWLGLVPQLTFWPGLTLVAGMLFGTVAAAVVANSRVRRRIPH